MPTVSPTDPPTPDPSTPATSAPATPAPPATFIDALHELRFTQQPTRQDGHHTTFQHLGDHQEILVYCHPDELADPDDDGSCSIHIECWQDGYRERWRMTIDHLDAIPLALTVLGTAVGANSDDLRR